MKRKVKSIIATFASIATMSLMLATSVSAAPSINYGIWKLQQPDGTTISSSQLVSGYSSSYFYVASDGGQAFMDTKTGASTGSSAHPRSELRELTSNGTGAAWSMTGTNTMSNSGRVTLQGGGTSGKTAIAQIFDTSGFPLCELQYTATANSKSGNFQLGYEEASGSGTNIYFSNTAALNTTFNYKLSLSGGVLTVYINGKQVYTRTPNLSGHTFYFKVGNYDQTATIGTVTTTPYTTVEYYSVNVVHQ